MENVIYHGLESSWTISHTEEHYQRLEKSMVYVKCGLLFISRLDLDIIEIPVNIQFGKLLCSLKLWNKLEDQGE